MGEGRWHKELVPTRWWPRGHDLMVRVHLGVHEAIVSRWILVLMCVHWVSGREALDMIIIVHLRLLVLGLLIHWREFVSESLLE